MGKRLRRRHKQPMENEEKKPTENMENEAAAETVNEAAATEAQPAGGELEAALAKAEEYLNMAQRVQADFDNFRRRNESVRTAAATRAPARMPTPKAAAVLQPSASTFWPTSSVP